MEDRKINILILGANKRGKALIDLFYGSRIVSILGVVDINADAPGIKLAKERGISTSNDYKEFLSKKELDAIIDVTGIHAVQEELFRIKPIKVEVIGAYIANLMWELIEERRRIEEELRGQEDRAQKYLDIAGVIIVAIDMDQRVSLINRKGCQILGYKEDEIIGKNWFDNFFPEIIREEVKTGFGKLINAGIESSEYLEYPVLTKKGEEKIIAWHNVALKDEEGKIVGVLSSGEDITTRRRLDQLKDEFLSTVSHELRTPLTTIREVVSQVLDGILGDTTKEQRDFLSMCLEDVDRLTRIVNDLLDISKIEAKKFEIKREIVDIAGLAKGVLSAFLPRAKENRLGLKLSLSKKVIDVYADRDNVTQVFTNLVGNAMKFTSAGSIEICVVDKEDWVECSVSDTGRGIAEEYLPKIFDKFQQLDRVYGPGQKGTGLGLSIVKGIIELHKGKVWVTSKLNEGSKFTFTLPKYKPNELFKEYLIDGLKEARKMKRPFSILVFDITNFDAIQEEIGIERITCLVQSLEELVKNNLRKGIDVAIKDKQAILVVLPGTQKKNASIIKKRVQQSFRDYLSKEKLGVGIALLSKVAGFPEDGSKYENLFAVAKSNEEMMML